VVLFHYGHHYYPFNIPVIKTAIDNAGFRVSFFFFISGFVMSLVYGQHEKINPKDFYFKRFTRIFPLYWLAFVFSFLLVLFINHASPKGLVIITHALGLQSCYAGFVLDLNYPTWSVSVELFFYACFPFVMVYMQKLTTQKLILFALIIWLMQTIEHIVLIHSIGHKGKVSEEFINAFPLWHLPTFFMGMITALIILRENVPYFFKTKSVYVLASCFLLLVYIVMFPNPIQRYIHNGLLSPVFALIIVALYFDKSIIGKTLNNNLLSKTGKISFSIFLFQYPIWILFNHFANKSFLDSGYFFAFYLIFLILFSSAVYLFIEKPLLKLLRKGD